MKPQNIRLRRRLSDIESQLLQIECPTNRRVSDRLKPERQHQLMKEKISIQESLNLIVYPILTLPVEVTSEIFLHCLPTEPDQPSTSVAPMVLGRICQQWRNIAYNNPRLWAAVTIRFLRGYRLDALVEDWLLRAGSMPLALRLILPPRCDESFFAERYVCGCPSSRMLADYWGRLISFHGDAFTPVECLHLLARAPRLDCCEFRTISSDPLPDNSDTPLILPDLTSLAFASIGSATSVFRILDLLTLPKLRSLSLIDVVDFFEQNSPFLSFLKRTPSIQSLHLYTIEVGDFTPILDVMPALTSLRITGNNTDRIFEIIKQLGEPTRTFLPRVQTLALSTIQSFVWKDHFTPTLVDTIVSRWDAEPGVARLLDFEFYFLLVGGAEVDEKIAECVSELKKKGMRIHVGAAPSRV
ncbi:hypothetical protein B0H19DRAFT_1117727 [Mycena capillaripes]|nr:hypothetical protein B0H19DRAFT_1117727 [Mycena capillaripes]